MQNGPTWTHVVAGTLRFDWLQGRLELVRLPTQARAGGGRLRREPIVVRALARRMGVIDISDNEMNDVIEHDSVIDISSDDDV